MKVEGEIKQFITNRRNGTCPINIFKLHYNEQAILGAASLTII